MKAWLDLKSIAVPECMKHRPRDSRGYPIPCNVQGGMGQDSPLDFRVIDHTVAEDFAKTRRCSMSGLPLGDSMVFIGGPLSALNGMYVDGPCLPAAADYALQVCPFLAAPKFGYVAADKDSVVPEVSANRPDVFVAVTTWGFHRIKLPSGARGFSVLDFIKGITVWKYGKPYGFTRDDLSNLSYRLLAARMAGVDPHTFTASWLFDVPPGSVSPAQRQLGKRATYVQQYTPSVRLSRDSLMARLNDTRGGE